MAKGALRLEPQCKALGWGERHMQVVRFIDSKAAPGSNIAYVTNWDFRKEFEDNRQPERALADLEALGLIEKIHQIPGQHFSKIIAIAILDGGEREPTGGLPLFDAVA